MFLKALLVVFFPVLVLSAGVLLGLAGMIYVAVILIAELRGEKVDLSECNSALVE